MLKKAHNFTIKLVITIILGVMLLPMIASCVKVIPALHPWGIGPLKCHYLVTIIPNYEQRKIVDELEQPGPCYHNNHKK